MTSEPSSPPGPASPSTGGATLRFVSDGTPAGTQVFFGQKRVIGVRVLSLARPPRSDVQPPILTEETGDGAPANPMAITLVCDSYEIMGALP